MSAMRTALIAAGFDPDSNAAELGRYLPPRRNRRIDVLRRLKDAEVEEIVEALREGASPTMLAKHYGCHRGTIYAIEAGRTYRDITGGGMIA